MKHKHEALKLVAVRYHLNPDNNSSYANTARIFETSERTLKRWIERFQQDGTIKRHDRPAKAYKVKQQHVDCAIQKVRQHKQVSVARFLLMIREDFPDCNITRRHLNNILLAKNYTRKRIRRDHKPHRRRNTEIDWNEEFRLFFAQIDNFDLNKIICIDESSMQVGMKKTYGRSRLGHRCRIRTTDSKVFQKHTFVGAVTAEGVEKHQLYQTGGMTSDRFQQFLQELLENKRGYCIVMDNAPVHRKRQVRSLIERSGNTLLYSLPYQPKLNAIETWFSQLKHHMTDMITSCFSEIQDAITYALTRIFPRHYLNIFRYAYRMQELRNRQRRRSTRYRLAKIYL